MWRPKNFTNPYEGKYPEFEVLEAPIFEAGADAISPLIAKAVYVLMMDDKYTHIEFRKEHYAEFLTKLRGYLGIVKEE